MIDLNTAARQDAPQFEDAETRKARIEAALKQNIVSVVKTMFPKSTSDKRTARIGDVQGNAGNSLAIALTSHEAGLFIDHATGERGDIFELIGRVYGLSDFPSILTEAEGLVGGNPTPRQAVHRATQEAKPSEPRPRTLETIEYVYRSKEGRRIATVYRDQLDNGKKKFRVHRSSDSTWSAPPVRPLYRLPDIASSQEVVLVEGEKCADALASVGIQSTSAMLGSNTKVELVDWTPLAGKSVTIWPDHDPKGLEYAGRVRPILEALGCGVRIIIPPVDKPPKWDGADAVEAGEDPRVYLAFENEVTILRENWDDIDYVYEGELVDELFPRVGVVTIYGPSTAGKSFVAIDWAVSIATGTSLLGKDTDRCAIAYCAFEGYYGLRKRIHGIKHHRHIKSAPITLIDSPWLINDQTQFDQFKQAMLTQKSQIEEMTGERLGVIVIDTLTSATAGSETNSQTDVTIAMKRLKRLSMELDCLILNVGHTGKDETRGMAGSFAYKSEADAFIEFRVERDEQTREVLGRSIFVDKVKDGPSGYVISDYELDVVSLGKKPNGRDITTCLVAWRTPKTKQEKQLGAMINHATRFAFELRTGPKSASELGEVFGFSRSRASEVLSWMEERKQVFSSTQGRRKMWELSNDVSTLKNKEIQDVND